jgi:hypothetical protein
MSCAAIVNHGGGMVWRSFSYVLLDDCQVHALCPGYIQNLPQANDLTGNHSGRILHVAAIAPVGCGRLCNAINTDSNDFAPLLSGLYGKPKGGYHSTAPPFCPIIARFFNGNLLI